MKTGESVIDYISKVMSVANKMKLHGENMKDVTIVEKIIRSLNEKFNYIVCLIEESKDTNEMLIDELHSSLVIHEQKFKKAADEEQAQKVSSEERLGSGGRGRGRGRGTKSIYHITTATRWVTTSVNALA